MSFYSMWISQSGGRHKSSGVHADTVTCVTASALGCFYDASYASFLLEVHGNSTRCIHDP